MRSRPSKPTSKKAEPQKAQLRSTPDSAEDFLPERLSMESLREAAKECRGCELYQKATQTVFGAGEGIERLMLVGEQPGDREDLEGEPFVGPAGQLLDEALAAAGLTRDEVYITNAVKHFKWVQSGQRRLHAKPNAREVTACRPWLTAEIQVLKPRTIVCLGATAAQALLGRSFRLTQHFGELLASDWAKGIIATYHPSAVLRAPDADKRGQMRAQLFDDIRLAVQSLHGGVNWTASVRHA